MEPPKTYTFSTFQELVDRVPSDRIRDCMEELGVILATAKASAELVTATALDLAGMPQQEPGARVIEIRDPFEWIDDGRRSLQSELLTQGGEHVMTTKVVHK